MGLRQVHLEDATGKDVVDLIQSESTWRHSLCYRGTKYSNMTVEEVDQMLQHLIPRLAAADNAEKKNTDEFAPPEPAAAEEAAPEAEAA